MLIVEGMAYTPRQALSEVTRGTPLGDKLQALVERGSFGTTFEEEQELIKERLTMDLESKPPDKVLFVALVGSGIPVRSFTAPQLLAEIRNNTTLGQQWIKNEKSYMLRLLQVR